jgi:Fe-S-cluster containining protein
VEKIAAHLHLDVPDFVGRFTELHPDRSGLVLKNRPNGECSFLEGLNTCLVQNAKPFQCQGFPNAWNFPGWQELCEAIPVATGEKGPS